MRTDIDKVYHWVLEGGEMPFKKKTMLECLDQIEKHIKKALKDLDRG
jgi:hypothetical protein